MKSSCFRGFRGQIGWVALALAPLIVSASDSRPYPRQPLPEELAVYRALLDPQKSQRRTFWMCDVAIQPDESLTHRSPDLWVPSVSGIPASLISELIVVNRRRPESSGAMTMARMPDADQLTWFYNPCPPDHRSKGGYGRDECIRRLEEFRGFVEKQGPAPKHRLPTVLDPSRYPRPNPPAVVCDGPVIPLPSTYTTLSRVAFDGTRANALVYSWFAHSYHSGYEEVIQDHVLTLLTKTESGAWKIVMKRELK